MAKKGKGGAVKARKSPEGVRAIDRRANGERRQLADRRAIERETRERRQRIRRAADRASSKPTLDARTRKNLTIGVGAILSIPAIRTWMDGGIPLSTGVIRIAIAMAFAFVAVSAIAALIRAYMPEPAVNSSATGEPELEDATLVEGDAET